MREDKFLTMIGICLQRGVSYVISVRSLICNDFANKENSIAVSHMPTLYSFRVTVNVQEVLHEVASVAKIHTAKITETQCNQCYNSTYFID